MNIVDRVLTILITATLTSAVWIVAGGSLIENANSASQIKVTRPAVAAPSPSPTDTMQAAVIETSTPQSLSTSRSNQLLIPVQNIRPSDLTDTYSDSREAGARLHEALDIMAPKGTTVLSVAPGEVERLFQSDAGGKTIYVRSVDGETIYYYAHLDSYAPGLKEGQRVRRGQRIGTVGSSGNASEEAPHLHFAILQTTADAEWWEPATAINPFPLLTAR